MIDFNDLKNEIEKMPMTWYPALLDIMVRESYKKKCWSKKGKCSDFVSKIEKKIRYKTPPEDKTPIELTCNKCFTVFEGKARDIHKKCHLCSGTLHKTQ